MCDIDRVYITWMAFRKCGATKKHVMQMFNCSHEQALQYYSFAAFKWGRGPYKSVTKDIKPLKIEEQEKPKKFERPPAVYSNKNWNDY